MNFLIFCILNLVGLPCFAYPDGDPQLLQPLRILLSDGAPIERIVEVANNIEAVLRQKNSNHYDVSILMEQVETETHVTHNDEFRILSLVETIGKTGITEAIDVLLNRIRERSPIQWRFDQWTIADVDAIVAIADKQPPFTRIAIQEKTVETLYKSIRTPLSLRLF